MFPTIQVPAGGVTLQWLYERVRDHLLKQGVKSGRETTLEEGTVHQTGNFFCLYRGPNNTACAAGCLIADPYYKDELENRPAGGSQVLRAIELSLGTNVEAYGSKLRTLQEIHDNKDPSLWQHELEQFALKNGLNP